MKFHEYETLFEFSQKKWKEIHGFSLANDKMQEFYSASIGRCVKDGWLNTVDGQLGIWRQQTELWWYKESRPYYKVFPCIMGCLAKLKLDIPMKAFDLKDRCFLIRFSEGNELHAGMPCKYILTAIRSERRIDAERLSSVDSGLKRMLVFVGEEFENTQGGYGIPISVNETFSQLWDTAERDETVRPAWSGCDWDVPVILKAAITIHLLADDPSIITPDVLSADRDRYQSETDEAWKQRAVDRARRRGVVGWNIGADYEVCPHYRRPHFGLRYTGKGRTVPRIVPIKGAVVHRSKLTEVPTGYMLPDGTEVEK